MLTAETSTIATPLQIWDGLSTKYYQSLEGNSIVRGIVRGQVLKRVHHACALHYGTDMHGRVEVPPIRKYRVIGWVNPALLNHLRYENIAVYLDGTIRREPDKFAKCVVLMVFDRGTRI
ncbi:hypothetical protein PHPALM_28212 [Phytophthora palmivora]|uniref:Uncharacterized protein n=1 Tax=Phytophthora palmivora TaxID=4796 RepID=A0A2P4XAM6_9STRA|nr:hypothetical protein PHPALM_28212 [Phytophthora palmivora]